MVEPNTLTLYVAGKDRATVKIAQRIARAKGESISQLVVAHLEQYSDANPALRDAVRKSLGEERNVGKKRK